MIHPRSHHALCSTPLGVLAIGGRTTFQVNTTLTSMNYTRQSLTHGVNYR